jgi:hypothetical protein
MAGFIANHMIARIVDRPRIRMYCADEARFGPTAQKCD